MTEPLEPLREGGPDTLLSMACRRSDIGLMDHLIKVVGCDPFGETTVVCTVHVTTSYDPPVCCVYVVPCLD